MPCHSNCPHDMNIRTDCITVPHSAFLFNYQCSKHTFAKIRFGLMLSNAMLAKICRNRVYQGVITLHQMQYNAMQSICIIIVNQPSYSNNSGSIVVGLTLLHCFTAQNLLLAVVLIACLSYKLHNVA